MRQYLLSLSSAAAVLLLLNLPATAQDEKEKDKEKDKNKVKQYDEIVIRKKSDKDSKVTVEIKDGQVTVNGKPMEDFDDDNVSVRKRGSTVIINGVGTQSPFRNQGGGGWSYSDDNPSVYFSDSKSAFLGVSTGESKTGAEIEEVTEKSAAEKAGLKKGDVITKIDDAAVFSQDDVSKIVLKHKPEDKVVITYKRDGKEQKTTATLGKRTGNAFSFNSDHFQMPNIQTMPAMPDMNFNWDRSGSGGRVFGLNTKPRLGIKAQDTEDGKGVKVLDVDDESAAGKAGIKEDDIITEFDGKTVNSADELANAARESKEKTSVNVKLKRDGKVQSVDIKTPKKLKTANL